MGSWLQRISFAFQYVRRVKVDVRMLAGGLHGVKLCRFGFVVFKVLMCLPALLCRAEIKPTEGAAWAASGWTRQECCAPTPAILRRHTCVCRHAVVITTDPPDCVRHDLRASTEHACAIACQKDINPAASGSCMTMGLLRPRTRVLTRALYVFADVMLAPGSLPNCSAERPAAALSVYHL